MTCIFAHLPPLGSSQEARDMLEKRVKLTSRRRSNGDTGEEEQRFKTYWATWCRTFAIHSQLMDKILRKVVYSTICMFFSSAWFLISTNFVAFCLPLSIDWFVERKVAVQRVGWRGISRPNLHNMWSAVKHRNLQNHWDIECGVSQNQFASWQLKMHRQARGCFAWICSFRLKMDGQMRENISNSCSWSAIHFFAAVSLCLGKTSSNLVIPCAPLRASMTVWAHFESMWVGSQERNLVTHRISCWRNL